MARKRPNLMTASEAAKYLQVSQLILDKIERQGGLAPYYTPGGTAGAAPRC
jgi:hypothetical protein